LDVINVIIDNVFMPLLIVTQIKNVNFIIVLLASSFHCPGTANTCIPVKWQCDGEKDCPEGKDEINCEVTHCETWQFPVCNL